MFGVSGIIISQTSTTIIEMFVTLSQIQCSNLYESGRDETEDNKANNLNSNFLIPYLLKMVNNR